MFCKLADAHVAENLTLRVEGGNEQFDQLLFNGIIRVSQVELFDSKR